MSLFPKIKQTVQLALPIVVGELGVMLMGLADTIQVGQMSTGAAESLGASHGAIHFFYHCNRRYHLYTNCIAHDF